MPVAVHMGPGPAGAAYDSSTVPFKSPSFRMAFGDPLMLEEVLLRHKRLRLSVMHAGWPRLESMVALLYAHPSVYVDLAGLQTQALVPRAAYLPALARSGGGRVRRPDHVWIRFPQSADRRHRGDRRRGLLE